MATLKHGDEALLEGIEKNPGRSSIFGITLGRGSKPVHYEPPPRPAMKPKPVRPVQASTVTLYERASRLRANPPRAIGGMLDGRPREAVRLAAPVVTYGGAAILAELARHNVAVTLTPDRAHIVVRAPGGKVRPDARDLLEREAPIIIAHLAGTELPCAVCKAPAVSMLIAQTPVCRACLEA